MVEDKTLYASSSEKMRQRGKKRKKQFMSIYIMKRLQRSAKK